MKILCNQEGKRTITQALANSLTCPFTVCNCTADDGITCSECITYSILWETEEVNKITILCTSEEKQALYNCILDSAWCELNGIICSDNVYTSCAECLENRIKWEIKDEDNV